MFTKHKIPKLATVNILIFIRVNIILNYVYFYKKKIVNLFYDAPPSSIVLCRWYKRFTPIIYTASVYPIIILDNTPVLDKAF